MLGTSSRADPWETSFRFHLVSADGDVVGTCERPTPLGRDDVVAGRWRVLGTLGHIARVEPLGDARARTSVIRVSASTESTARLFAEKLGGDARAACTAHGWIVSLPLGEESRVSGLTRLAAASRAVVAAYPDAELFVLDARRPVRLPPRL